MCVCVWGVPGGPAQLPGPGLLYKVENLASFLQPLPRVSETSTVDATRILPSTKCIRER